MERMYSKAEAARALGVCLRSLCNLLDRPNAPRVVRIGRRVLIPESSLQDWIRENAR